METRPAGLWDSSITAALAAARSASPSEIRVDSGEICWLESRPAEGGRTVIVRKSLSGKISEILPPPFSVRSRVHEYGGGAYAAAGGVLYFSSAGDGRLYRLESGQKPRPLTPEGDFRYADLSPDPRRGRLLAIREDHRGPGFPINTLISVDLRGRRPVEVLFSGRDFYAAPRISPDGSRIAFLAWNLPDMPWDGTELWTAGLDGEGRPGPPEQVAGGREESIFQPRWSPSGELYFVSDRTGWWNIHRLEGGGIAPVCPMEAEFGLPLWSLGVSTYAFTGSGRLFAAFCRSGIWRLAEIPLPEGRPREVDTGYTEISGLEGRSDSVVFLAASPRRLPAVVEYRPGRDPLSLPSPPKGERVPESCLPGCLGVQNRPDSPLPVRGRGARGEGAKIDPGLISDLEPIEFPTGVGETAYGFFYPAANPDFGLPEGELPPLLVNPHGGPTGAGSTALNLKTLFWTSRGFAVLLVNYRGSTGYGRTYREALNGCWGEADVEDCLNGARWLAERGRVDPGRMAIRGSSAGGFTALLALTRSDLFRAGAVYYGVSDLELLAAEDHKFESGSLTRLVGPYPERRDLYRDRSPLRLARRISAPVIFFQGEEDRIVPPEQTARMAAALKEKNLPAEVVYFPGEGHGFRNFESIRRALEAEYAFYRRFLLGGSGRRAAVK